MTDYDYLTSAEVKEMIITWDRKSIEEFVKEYDVSTHTINVWVDHIRKLKPDACPTKTITDIAIIECVKSSLNDLDDLDNND